MAVNILMDVPKILLGGWSHGLQVTNFNFTKKLEFFYEKKCFHEQVHSICFRNKSLFFTALAGTCIVLIVVHIIQLVLIPKITRQIRKYDRANDYDYDYD